eukprot:999188-Amphidinium_carterae.1
MSGGIGLRVNFIICDVPCPIIGNSTMEENQCYAIVKSPPHKSWIMSLHFNSWRQDGQDWQALYIHSHVMDGFINNVQIIRSQINASLSSESYGICGPDMTTHEEEPDQQHAEDVARSFSILDPENQPDFIADGTQSSTSEAAPPISVAAPRSYQQLRESFTISLTLHSEAGVGFASGQRPEAHVIKAV